MDHMRYKALMTGRFDLRKRAMKTFWSFCEEKSVLVLKE